MSKEKKLVPKLRFEQFKQNDNWIQDNVGEYYFFKNGLNKGKEYFGYGIPIVNYMDVFQRRRLYTENLKGKVNVTDAEVKNYNVLKGDIFFTRTSETLEEIGYPSVILDSPQNAVFSGFVLRARPKNTDPLDINFKSYVFFTSSFRNEMIKMSSMSTRALTSGTAIKKMKFNFPKNKSEQKKIGNFFKKLDRIIQLQQSKVKKLKDIKTAYLSEMFPKEGEIYPRKRFDGFTEPWKETRMIDFVSKAVDNRGKTPPLSTEGTHPLIEVSSIGYYNPDYSKIEKYLDDTAFNNNLRGYIKQNDILFSTVGRIGLVSLMDKNKDAAIAQNIVAFRAKENNVPEYIYALLTTQTNKERAERIVMGAVQPSIKVSQLENVKYSITDNAREQQMIGSFFTRLENIILYNNKQLKKLEKLKEGYLNDMFI